MQSYMKHSIPDGWKETTLGNIGEFSKGKNISLKDTIPDGIPATMYGDIYVKYDTFFHEVDFRISEETASKSTPITRGTLLFTGSGETAIEIGKCVVYLGEKEVYIGGDIIAFTPYEDDSLFLAYQQNWFELIKQKARFAQGHSVVHIYTGQIGSLKVMLPPLDEQRKIAEILSTWDEAIQTTEKLIAALEKRKKGLMQRLLTGQLRFPGFTEEWEEEKLFQVVDLFFSNVDKVINQDEKKVRLCNYMDVFNNYYITNEIPFMDGSVKPKEFEKFLLKRDDVILTKDSETAEEIAESAVVVDKMVDVVCGYHLAILRPKEKLVSGLFLMYLLHHESVHLQFVKRANGITRYGLTISSIENVNLFLPSINEQRKISDILLTCDTEISKHKSSLSQLQQQKQGLMQRLLTGQVRVSV